MHRQASLRPRRVPPPSSRVCAGSVGRIALWACVLLAASPSCSTRGAGSSGGLGADAAKGVASLGAGQWQAALTGCQAGEKADPMDCGSTYCDFIARTMMVVDQMNGFLLPRYRRPLTQMPGDAQNLALTNTLLAAAEASGEATIAKKCEIDVPSLPLLMGDAADPVLKGEIRGLWTTRDAHMVTALLDSIAYGLQAEFMPQMVPAVTRSANASLLQRLRADFQRMCIAGRNTQR